jgi:hypothetical protein
MLFLPQGAVLKIASWEKYLIYNDKGGFGAKRLFVSSR